MLAFGRGFCLRCARPKGLRALWNPGRGCPRTAACRSASRRPCRGPSLAEGQGCRGRAPPTPCRQGWVAPVASGAVSSPLRGCGPHHPLDPPSARKTRQRPAQGLGGALPEWMGVKAGRRPPRSGLALTPRNDPTPGLVAGVLFPSRLPRGERPRRAAGGALICSCFARFRRNNLSAPSACGRI